MYLVIWTSTISSSYGQTLTVARGAKLFTKPEEVKRFSRSKWAEGFETSWFKWNTGGIRNGAGTTIPLTDEEYYAIADLNES